MANLANEFQTWAAAATPQDREDALKIVRKQTEMTVSALEELAKGIMGSTDNHIWRGMLEKRNLQIEELLQIENILTLPN